MPVIECPFAPELLAARESPCPRTPHTPEVSTLSCNVFMPWME